MLFFKFVDVGSFELLIRLFFDGRDGLEELLGMSVFERVGVEMVVTVLAIEADLVVKHFAVEL